MTGIHTGICKMACGEEFDFDDLVGDDITGTFCRACWLEHCADTGDDPHRFDEPDCTAYYDRGDAA